MVYRMSLAAIFCFPTNFPTSAAILGLVRTTKSLRIGHCGYRAKCPGQHGLPIKQLNRFPGGTRADVRVVIKHSFAHVAYKGLDGPKRHTPLNHVSNKAVTKVMESQTLGWALNVFHVRFTFLVAAFVNGALQ